MSLVRPLKEVDPEIYDIIKREENRQEDGIELIASENYPSLAVLEAQACIMGDKYAEGYPGKRYYGGCEHIDESEELARQRAKKIFEAEHANVQAHSGAQANMEVFFAMLEFGDTILSMDLSHGGHLTHGSPVNFSGKFYNIIPYHVDKENERIDMAEVDSLARKHKPKLVLVGASAYPREIDFKAFGEVADSVGALMMCDIAHISGLVVAGEHPKPFPYADFVTTTSQKTLRGPRGGIILCKEEYAKAIDKAVFPMTQGGPFQHTIAAKAVCFKEAMDKGFRDYQKQVKKNAQVMAKELEGAGCRLVSNGTDNHLMMVDMRSRKMNGKEGQILLDEIGISCNKQMIPYDPEKPFIGSGVRLGTPALTTRGMNEKEAKMIAGFINAAIESRDSAAEKEKIKKQVVDLCRQFPIYRRKK